MPIRGPAGCGLIAADVQTGTLSASDGRSCKRNMAHRHWFRTMAQNTARAAGSSAAFSAICILTLGWLVLSLERTVAAGDQHRDEHRQHAGGLPDQNPQNRQSAPLQLKLDEGLRGAGVHGMASSNWRI